MRDIPAGTFTMGANDYSAESDQSPVHAVTLSGFAMQETEVTQGQYEAVVGRNPSWENFRDDPEAPVEMVTWFDAVPFCNQLSRKESRDTVYSYAGLARSADGAAISLDGIQADYSRRGYRLPTEAEWVVRGGSWFDDYTALKSFSRHSWSPGEGSYRLGFRVVLPD